MYAGRPERVSKKLYPITFFTWVMKDLQDVSYGIFLCYTLDNH